MSSLSDKIWAGDFNGVRDALIYQGLDPNLPNDQGGFALGDAVLVRDRDTAMLITILDAGGNPNLRSPKGQTPLFYAVFADRPDICTLLLEGTRTPGIEPIKAEPDMTDLNGETALMHACRSGSPCAEVLLKHGADPNIISYNGDTALLLAAVKAIDTGNTDIMELLLKAGADTEIKRYGQITPVAQVVALLFEVKRKLGEEVDMVTAEANCKKALQLLNVYEMRPHQVAHARGMAGIGR